MNFDKQFSSSHQPLRAAINQRPGFSRAEHIQFTEGHHNEIELFFRLVVANVLLVIGNIKAGRLRLLTSPVVLLRQMILQHTLAKRRFIPGDFALHLRQNCVCGIPDNRTNRHHHFLIDYSRQCSGFINARAHCI